MEQKLLLAQGSAPAAEPASEAPPAVQRQLDAQAKELHAKTEALAAVQGEAEALRQRLAASNIQQRPEETGLQAQVQTLTEELQRAKEETARKVEAIKQKAVQRETKIKDSAKGLVQPLTEQNKALKEQVETQAELIQTASQARADLEAQLVSRAAAHDALAAEHAELCVAHDAKVAAEGKLAAELAATSASSASTSESLASELAEVKAQLSSSEASLAALQGELSVVAAKESEAHSEQASAHDALMSELETLRSELACADGQLKALSVTAADSASQLQTELVALRSELLDSNQAVKAAEKRAKKETMKSKALKAMLEEHSLQAEDQASANQVALEATRAAIEAEIGTELNNYRDALGAARVKVQSLEGECIQLREKSSALERDLLEQRRVAKEWEGESTRLAEFVEKLSSTSSSSKKALVQLEMELAAAKKQAKESSQAILEREEFKTLSARLTSELSNRDAELQEIRIKLTHTESLVGGSRDEAEAAESLYSKLQARLIETEAAKEEMAEALRKRLDLKTAEAAKHRANVERLGAVLENFQIERQQAETKLDEQVRSASAQRDAAQQQLAELQAEMAEHSLQTVEQQLRESEASRQALAEHNDTLERQCDRLRGMVEGAVARAATQEQEDGTFVDRHLVTKLLCTYVTSASSQQREVLEVMARILQCDEDAKEVLGLGEVGWSSYLPFGLGAKPPRRPQMVKDGDIADEWANFLLNEIADGPGKGTVTLGVKVGVPNSSAADRPVEATLGPGGAAKPG